MAKARKILKRVKAIKNIRTVTKTMEMVATARFKKSHDRVVAARPYTDRLSYMVGDLLARGSTGQEMNHPLLTTHPTVKTDVLLVLTSNRGLCGGYNSSVLRAAVTRMDELHKQGRQVRLHVSGKRGIQYFRFRGVEVEKAYTQFDDLPKFEAVSALAQELVHSFLAAQVATVEVAYMQFMSAGVQRATVAPLLPLSDLEPPPREMPVSAIPTPYELIPSAGEILNELLPATARLRVYQCFLDAAVSEHVARIAAMRAATESAEDMIHDLTVKYNRMRQSQITTELAEIMGGRAALQ